MIQESNGYTYYKYDYSENCSWAVLKNGYVPETDVFHVPSTIDGCDVLIIEDDAFQGNPKVREIVLPDYLQELDTTPFSNFPNLECIHINRYLHDLSCYVFDEWPNLNIVFDNGNEYITIINDIVLTNNGEGVLAALFNRDRYVIPEGVKTISSWAFLERENTTSIQFPHTLKKIEDWCFNGMKKIKRIVFPYGLEEIEEHCFCECDYLEYIDLPISMRRLGRFCFSECTNLRSLIIRSPVFLTTYFDEIPFDSCSVYVPRELLDVYRTDSIWGKFKSIEAIEDNTQITI